MAYSTEQLADLLFKKVATGKATSDTTKAFFEESINSRKSVFSSDIWNQSDLIPITAPTLVADAIYGIVQFKENIALIPIPGTNAFTTGLSDIIPFNYGDGSYNYLLKDGLGNQIAPGTADWFLDTESGLVTFFDGGSAFTTLIGTGTLTLTIYTYIGTKGVTGNASSSAGNTNGWFTPVLSELDAVTFEAITTPINGNRYLINTTTSGITTIHDPNTMIATTNQIVSADSIVEWFDDVANAGANAGWIIDFNGSIPSNGANVTVLNDIGFLYQYHTGVWNKNSYERTYPSRNYKNLDSAPTLSDGDEFSSPALIGGLIDLPTEKTYVSILINGVQVSIEDNNTPLATVTSYCYFSSDSGTTAKSLDLITTGDRLYWKGSIAGFELEVGDKFDINFVTTKNN